MSVRVQQAAFDLGAELAAFAAGCARAGAVVSFTGVVRNDGGTLEEMNIEHYPGMTEKALAGIEAEAVARWHLESSLIIHRFGVLRPGEKIMMVATAAQHRGEAFAAAEFLMDYLKSRAPFWKQERRVGGASWVAAKAADEASLGRW